MENNPIPQKPEEYCGSLQMNSLRIGLLGENRLVIAMGTDGLGIINVTNPSKPFIERTIEIGEARDVFIGNGFIFAATMNRGLIILDIKSLEKWPDYKAVEGTARCFRVHGEGDAVFLLADGMQGNDRVYSLIAVDISDPGKARIACKLELSRYNTQEYGYNQATGLFVLKGRLYVSWGYEIRIDVSDYMDYGGIDFYDIRKLDNPVKTGSVSDWRNTIGNSDLENYNGICAINDNIIVACDNGLCIINTVLFDSPKIIKEFRMQHVEEVMAYGNLVLAVSVFNGLFIAEVSDPVNPVIKHSYRIEKINHAASDGRMIYVSNEKEGLRIYPLKV